MSNMLAVKWQFQQILFSRETILDSIAKRRGANHNIFMGRLPARDWLRGTHKPRILVTARGGTHSAGCVGLGILIQNQLHCTGTIGAPHVTTWCDSYSYFAC